MSRFKTLKIFCIAVVLGSVVVVFQNCGPAFQTLKPSDLSSLSANSPGFGKAMEVLQSRCVSCHRSGGTAASTPFTFSHESQFIAAGLVTPGSLSNSKLIFRLRNYPIDNGVRNMPPGTAAALTEDEYASLTNWVLTIGQTNVNAFTCEPSEPPGEQNAKRLSKAEYHNAIRSLLTRALGITDTTTLLNQLNLPNRLLADGTGSYSTSDTNFSVLHATEFFNIADAVSTSLINTANYARFVNTYIGYSPGSCVVTSVDTLSPECQNTLIRNFLLRAWGRPIETTTTNANNELASFQREFQLATTSRAGVEAVVMKALIAPQFLFHLQIDLRNQQGDVYQLSSHAIARRLAFIFTQTLPDETLLDMAARQDLGDEARFTEALTYLAARMDLPVQQFTREWLHLDQLPPFVEQAHPKFQLVSQGITANDSLKAAMRNEVLELMTYINRNNRSFRDILTTNISFARDASLMRIYGQNVPAPAVVTEANAVRFPAAERSGVLTRAAMLMSGGHTENPILRGIHIRKYLLCLSLPQPEDLPPGSLGPPLPDPQLTTRERYHNKTSGQACINCHSQINPIGFAFSKYNAFGAYQPSEPIFNDNELYVGQLPTDSTSNLQTAIGIDREVRDGIELSEVIAGTPQFKGCLTKNFYAYANGLQELPTGPNSCGMNRMYQSLNDGASLQDFFKSSVQDSRFRYRKLSR